MANEKPSEVPWFTPGDADSVKPEARSPTGEMPSGRCEGRPALLD